MVDVGDVGGCWGSRQVGMRNGGGGGEEAVNVYMLVRAQGWEVVAVCTGLLHVVVMLRIGRCDIAHHYTSIDSTYVRGPFGIEGNSLIPVPCLSEGSVGLSFL